MRLKDFEGWKKSLESNKDGGYWEEVLVFCSLWASLMEIQLVFEKQRLENIAESCEKQALELMGQWSLTGFQYGVAVSILSRVWEYGEALRCWHNLRIQIHDEGIKANERGDVLNPAFI